MPPLLPSNPTHYEGDNNPQQFTGKSLLVQYQTLKMEDQTLLGSHDSLTL